MEMTKRFTGAIIDNEVFRIERITDHVKENTFDDVDNITDLLNEFHEENERLKLEIDDKNTLIKICEKKFRELGYMISCDDDGYIVEKI